MPLTTEVLNILHSLSSSELEIVSSLKHHFLSLSHSQKLDFIPSLSFYCSIHPSFTDLVCSVFRECLRAHSESFVSSFKPHLIYDLLNGSGHAVSDHISTFIHELCQVKQSLGLSFQAETLKLLSELSRHQRLSLSPPSAVRGLVLRLWQDFPATRPRHFALVRLLLQWLSLCPVAHSEIPAIFRLLRVLQKSSAAISPDQRRVFDLELVYYFVNLVLLDKISDVSQLALVLIPLEAHLLVPVFRLFSVGELVAVWTRLVVFTPLVPAACGLQVTVNLFQGSPYVLVPFLYHLFLFLVNGVSHGLKSHDQTSHHDMVKLGESLLRIVVAKGVSPLLRSDVLVVLNYFTDINVTFRRGVSIYRVPEFKQVVEHGKQWWHLPDSVLGPGPLELGRPELSQVFTELPGGLRPHLGIPEFYSSQVMADGPYLPSTEGEVMVEIREPKGIQNFNNTCFLSSVLQSLFGAGNFVSSLFNEEANVVAVKLQQVFVRLMVTQHEFIEISDFLRALPKEFRSGEQQDASEFLRFLFDQLSSNVVASTTEAVKAGGSSKGASVVVVGGSREAVKVGKEFKGKISQIIECMRCKTKSEREEEFTDLMVTVPGEAASFGKQIVLDELVREYFRVEKLVDDNKYLCSKCGDKQDANKYMQMKEFPDYLVLVLNRFSFDASLGEFKKENTPVDVVGGCAVGGVRYKAFAVVVHEGASVSEGHYTANVLYGDTWYAIDDTEVRKIDDVRRKLAGVDKPSNANYMVFLVREGVRVGGGVRVGKEMIQEAKAIEDAAVHL